MLKVKQYSSKGVKTADFSLPKNMEEKENLDLIAQSKRVSEWKKHPGLSRVKTRSEIKRTTKKWYRQKGTGRARHGARSAPIFVGGGVAHGPKGIKKGLNLSKKMSKKSLNSVISLKVKENRVIVVNLLSNLKKSKDVQLLVNKILKDFSDKIQNITFVFSKENKDVQKAFKNLKNTKTELFENLNSYKVLNSGLIVFDKSIFQEKKEVKEKTKER